MGRKGGEGKVGRVVDSKCVVVERSYTYSLLFLGLVIVSACPPI